MWKLFGPALCLFPACLILTCAETKQRASDPCERLEQSIQGRKHGFLAGNLAYYIGGFHASWTPAPGARFVVATLGQTSKLAEPGNDKLILDAQLAVDGSTGKYPEFKGNVSTVYTHPLSQGGASNSHYNGNAQTYMDVGLAMGEAMLELLKNKD